MQAYAASYPTYPAYSNLPKPITSYSGSYYQFIPINTYLAYLCLSIPISIHLTIVSHIQSYAVSKSTYPAYSDLSKPITSYPAPYYKFIPIQPFCTYLYLSAYTSLQTPICRHMLHHNLTIQPIQTYLNLSLAIHPIL